MNKEEKEDYVYTYTQKIISQVVSDNDDETIKAIKRYCEENNVFPNLISEERLKEILELGISKKTKIDDLQSQLDMANKKLDKIEKYIKENACYSETKKECLCSFSSMALDKILEIIGGE